LDGIGASFVTRLPASSVLLNFLFCQRGEGNGSGREILDDAPTGDEANAGVDKMVAAGEPAEHAAGVLIVARLAEDFLVWGFAEGDDGVGGKNDVSGIVGDSEGLFSSDALDEGGGRFSRQRFFGDGTGTHDMRQAGGEQEFMAARRGRGQDKHVSPEHSAAGGKSFGKDAGWDRGRPGFYGAKTGVFDARRRYEKTRFAPAYK